MSQPLSSRFLKIYNDLPPEAQQSMLEKSLTEALDHLPPDMARKVYSSALRIHTKHENVPKLDLKGKRKQVGSLLEILHKESKIILFADRTSREEIVSEILHALTGWLNDVWSTFYEHHMQYMQAHGCLLFVAEVLSRLDSAPNPSGCKCDLLNLPIRVTIKDKAGQTMNRLRVRGPHNVDRLLLWIWRDLLLCMLAKGSKKDKEHVTDILGDLESIYGFPILERLVNGGRKCKSASHSCPHHLTFLAAETEEDEDEEDIFLEDETYSDVNYDEVEGLGYPFFLFPQANLPQSNHWGGKFTDERVVLCNKIEDYLFKIFSITPNLALYETILDISLNRSTCIARASNILSEIAGSSSETLTAALSIEVSRDNASKILSLLDQYSYLLRPRDAVHLQCAAAVLGDSIHHARGLAILETGLEETLEDIHMAARRSFVHIEESVYKKELMEIIKLRSGSQTRRERIDAWSDAIMTSSSPLNIGHPMAAMMFGIPMMLEMSGMGDDGDETSDLLNFIDLEGSGDADLDDIREEFRPRLKQRFEGWTQLATVMKGGAPVAAKIYSKAVETMPFLRAADVVNEMVNRLGDRPGKAFVCDALEALSSFCKTQRKKLNTIRKKEKQAAAKTSAAPGTPSTPAAGSSTAAGAGPSTTPNVSTSSRASGTRQPSDDDGPPPLVPLSPFSLSFSAPSPTPPPGVAPVQVNVDVEAPFRIFQGMEDVD